MVIERILAIASGLIDGCRQLGAAVGPAALVTVAAGLTSRSDAVGAAAVVAGYRAAFVVRAVIRVVSVAFALRLDGAATRPGNDDGPPPGEPATGL